MVQMESGRAFSLQACANSLWALGVLQAANNATAMRIIHLISQYDYTELIATQLHQLFQACLPNLLAKQPACLLDLNGGPLG